MDNNSKIMNLLGLAKRAGKVSMGQDLVLREISKSSKNLLVFIASDAGENIRKKINDKTKYYELTLINTFDTDDLSKALGSVNRKTVVINDKGFIKKIKELYNS
ncbi:MAG: ribosomal L7Ae/L30e/S12e/Gadd45 family protein [Candidatus Izemoplasma sp.]